MQLSQLVNVKQRKLVDATSAFRLGNEPSAFLHLALSCPVKPYNYSALPDAHNLVNINFKVSQHPQVNADGALSDEEDAVLQNLRELLE